MSICLSVGCRFIPLRKLKTLTKLDLDDSNITNVGLEIISKHPTVNDLLLIKLPNIDDEGMKHLAAMNLNQFFIKHCEKVSHAGIDFIRNNNQNYWMNDLDIKAVIEYKGPSTTGITST